MPDTTAVRLTGPVTERPHLALHWRHTHLSHYDATLPTRECSRIALLRPLSDACGLRLAAAATFVPASSSPSGIWRVLKQHLLERSLQTESELGTLVASLAAALRRLPKETSSPSPCLPTRRTNRHPRGGTSDPISPRSPTDGRLPSKTWSAALPAHGIHDDDALT